LFHGYPFVSEFLTVAKTHPRVYLDMVWMPFLSMKASEQFLAEMLDVISCNKTTFGCDVTAPEHTYGTAELGRDLLAKVLAERIADGYLTERLALRIAHMLLHENAEQLYSR
jgi:predicted TIM-barrel fold metal-dependent hydrolase